MNINNKKESYEKTFIIKKSTLFSSKVNLLTFEN